MFEDSGTCEQGRLGTTVLEHRTFSWKESLKHRLKMIRENASIMVTCDHPTNTTRGPNPREDIAAQTITEPPPLCFTVGTRQST
ncbi:hypothetical protein TNCV_4767101 [Trichonephila clavipes]|nr:hypothetical protein TNCV_4767101 [Trichonephila clavipes]